MKAKKNEPLSSNGQKRPRVAETTSSVPVPLETRVASPTISLEEITSHQKKTRGGD